MTYRPAFDIRLEGRPIADELSTRLIDLTLTDKRGLEADQLDLTISDHDGRVVIPSRGVVLTCAIGWQSQGEPELVDKGRFIVDEVEHSGAPDKLIIRARSADFREGFKTQKERSWHQQTLGQIVNTLAKENQLTANIESSLSNTAISHIDQTNESDANFLTRLAKQHDAIITVKNGQLLVLPIGNGKTINKTIPTMTLTRQDGDKHRFTIADRESTFSGVKAKWHDTNSAKTRVVIIGENDNLKTLRQTYSSESTARKEAEAEWKRLQRAKQQMELTLAHGNPELFPQMPVKLEGWKASIDEVQWQLWEVVHSINGSGFVSRVRLEVANNATV
ncbi:phage late control D family protein [Alteromonas sp. a30]|uniref:phage late control D family protein n=1 Tax=Alteromonas sp. a30 TaxID=2730917 RepID=UPI00227DBF83|nr:phage late control D family protein [Alteromonas sp. a30]MCY7297412.1 phage late control D family protein [Alteromonas sp. a30]